MKKKATRKKAVTKKHNGTQILGKVDTRYVQYNVIPGVAKEVANVLSQYILREVQLQSLREVVTDVEEK